MTYKNDAVNYSLGSGLPKESWGFEYGKITDEILRASAHLSQGVFNTYFKIEDTTRESITVEAKVVSSKRAKALLSSV